MYVVIELAGEGPDVPSDQRDWQPVWVGHQGDCIRIGMQSKSGWGEADVGDGNRAILHGEVGGALAAVGVGDRHTVFACDCDGEVG